MADNPLIARGANISELAALFGRDRKEVRARLNGVAPLSGNERSGIDHWRVKDVASRLVRMDESMADLVSQILATHHTDLPKMLSKEYWYGQNQRLNYLRQVGDLWDTQAVVELASEVFKTLRLSLMLASDTVERKTKLSPQQREIIEELMHEALNDAREKLVVRLEILRKNSSGKTFAPKESSTVDGVSGSGDELDEWGDPIEREPRPGDVNYL